MDQHLGLTEWVQGQEYHQQAIQHQTIYCYGTWYEYEPWSSIMQELLELGPFNSCMLST